MKITGFTLTADGPPRHLVLTKAPAASSEAAPAGYVFLMELPSGSARCGIYAHRPGACRTFPTVLRLGTAAIRPDVLCGPIAWSVATMDLPTLRRDLNAQAAAWAETEVIAVNWNRRVGRARTPKRTDDLFRYLLSSRTS